MRCRNYSYIPDCPVRGTARPGLVSTALGRIVGLEKTSSKRRQALSEWGVACSKGALSFGPSFCAFVDKRDEITEVGLVGIPVGIYPCAFSPLVGAFLPQT